VGNKSKLLSADVVASANSELKKLGSYGYISRKLLAVIASSKYGITEVAKIYDISRATLISWIKHIKANNLQRLAAPPERKRKTKLSKSQIEEIKSWITEDPNITIKALRIRIEDLYGIILGKSTVHRIMSYLKFSYITPRPSHYKKDEHLAEEFKKKSKADNEK
jgi:transposase